MDNRHFGGPRPLPGCRPSFGDLEFSAAEINELLKRLIKMQNVEGLVSGVNIVNIENRELLQPGNLTLEDLGAARLENMNDVFVPWQGSAYDTRNYLPALLRRKGISISYITDKGIAVKERAVSDVGIDNANWGIDSNWMRVDELSLNGELYVSPNGTWVINGVDSGIQALGPKGDNGLTPRLKTIDNKLHYSYDGKTWVDSEGEYISAWFRWSGNKIQISRDNKTWEDFSGEFADNLFIKGYVATFDKLPADAVQGDIWGVGPRYAAEDTENTNPIYRYWVRNADGWVDNGEFTSIAAGIVQETGDGEGVVMSQKAVSGKLAELESNFSNIVSVDGSILLKGRGAESFTTNIRLKKDRIYKVVPSKTSWGSSQPQGYMIMALYAYTDGSESTIFRYGVGDDVPSVNLVDTTNSKVDYYKFSWRGDVGVEMSVDFIETNPTIDNSLLDRAKLVGEGNEFVKRYIKLNSNKVYEITPSITDWATSKTETAVVVLGLYKVLNGVETRVIGYVKDSKIPSKIYFDSSEHDADYYILGWRGDDGVQMSVDFIELDLSKLSKDDFAIGSLSSNGYVDYVTYDTISSKGYYNISELSYLTLKVKGDARKRISWYDAEFNLLSVTSWLTNDVISIPDNASYCKVGIRPYENNEIKHSSDNIISTDLADEVVSNLPTMEFANNIKNVHSKMFKVGFNIPSVSNLVVVAKAETSATLSINYYTRTNKYSFCSNCVIGNKREVVNLILPPIMYDGNAFEVVIDGKCDIELLNVEPINIQSHDTHIRVSAHLGYRLYFPENTKLAYKMAAMCGMWGSVANVHETADGGLICYHQNDARLSEDGKTIISLTPSDINSKTTEQMTSYNAGVYMSPYYTDENVPTFDEYCQIMAKGNMHPILSTNAITENLYSKVKAVLDKYGLTSKTIIRSYSTSYLQRAYSVFGDSVSYCFDAGQFTEDKISSWHNMNFGNAEKIVGFDWMHTATDEAIDEALNSVLSKGMRVIPDAKDNYELFRKLINKGVRDFTVNHFISANML